MTQELGILSLIKLGVRIITASGDDLTDTSDPMKKAMRQIAGAFAARSLDDGRSLRKIAASLADQGFVTPSGRAYSASAVQSMLSAR